VREIRTLRAMRRGLETGLRLGYCGTPRGNGEQQIGLTFGTPRQSSTLLGVSYVMNQSVAARMKSPRPRFSELLPTVPSKDVVHESCLDASQLGVPVPRWLGLPTVLYNLRQRWLI